MVSLKMEDFLDGLWLKILVFVYYIKTLLDLIFAPLNSLGPAIAIFTIALVTVIITKILAKAFITKRYKQLKKNFDYFSRTLILLTFPSFRRLIVT